MSDLHSLRSCSGQYCPDCGLKHVECACPHRGNTLPAVPKPRFEIGATVYRARQTAPPMVVLDRICVMLHEAECDDGYDGHSAISRWKIEWRYETTCHWRPSTRYDESELATRAEHLPFVVWYYGPFSSMPGIEHVRKCVPDVTEAEYLEVLDRVVASAEAQLCGQKAHMEFPWMHVRVQ